ncbi:MAG: hypothetical protein ABIJ31_04785 [Pseudomonadota bacterium]
MMKEKKIDKERQLSYNSLPPGIKENLTEEEKHAFLYEESWPDTLFEKLDEFIVKKE